jgi:uncharacterized protein (DUF486 family)
VAAIVSWGIALFEYLLQGPPTAVEIQEVRELLLGQFGKFSDRYRRAAFPDFPFR